MRKREKQVGHSCPPSDMPRRDINQLIIHTTTNLIPFYLVSERKSGEKIASCNGNSKYNMRNLHYPNRTIRVSEKVWDCLKEKRKKSGLTWNLYLKFLLEPTKNNYGIINRKFISISSRTK